MDPIKRTNSKNVQSYHNTTLLKCHMKIYNESNLSLGDFSNLVLELLLLMKSYQSFFFFFENVVKAIQFLFRNNPHYTHTFSHTFSGVYRFPLDPE